jgi:hypothetical protein
MTKRWRLETRGKGTEEAIMIDRGKAKTKLQNNNGET